MNALVLQALRDHLGEPHDGSLAFARFFALEEISGLLSESAGEFAGWRVLGVGDPARGAGWIGGDRAVEIREDKRQAALLLVDAAHAGAGMDGIYNAAGELIEDVVFASAIEGARAALEPALRLFGDEAVRRSKRVAGQRRTAPLRDQLAFYLDLARNAAQPGRVLGRLGLWPVAGDAAEAMAAIPNAVLLVEKLLLPPATSLAPALRVESLALPVGADGAKKALENLLRQAGGRTLRETLDAAAADSSLSLGEMRPGFLTHTLQKIEFVSWRGNHDRLLKWSGLTLPDSSEEEAKPKPRFILAKADPKCALEVRWRILPDDLPPGAANFDVRMLCNGEEIASQTFTHRGGAVAKAVFTPDDFDFEELDANSKREVQMVISSPGNPELPSAESEDFLLMIGDAESEPPADSAREIVRCVADGVAQAATQEALEEFLGQRAEGKQGRAEKPRRNDPGKADFLDFQLSGTKARGFRVERPGLLRMIEENWARRTPPIRWRATCRPDGSWLRDLEHVPLLQGGCPDGEWSRLLADSKRFCDDCLKSGGILSRLYLHGHSSATVAGDYLNAWQAALEAGAPELALANTLEIRTLGGQTVGLVVLPFHPLRVAWQCAYDTLAVHLRLEEKLSARKTRAALKWLDGANIPFVLPGLRAGETFLFSDTVGLAGTLMISSVDPEPKAATALLAACYTGDSAKLAPALSQGSGDALAREVTHYLDTHPAATLLQVHALRPGDGATVVRALGSALKFSSAPLDEGAPLEDESKLRAVAVQLDLHPSSEQQSVAGRHLTRLTQRRRIGTAAPPPEDAWVLGSLPMGGDRSIPRLRWARRSPGGPATAAHVAMAFDMFESAVVTRASPLPKMPLLAYGLVAHLQRAFRFENGQPQWRLSVSEEHDGLKLPGKAIVTDRLMRMQGAILRTTAAWLGDGRWPELLTAPSAENVDLLRRLHQLCDWVITVDRNAGIEYYDSPREAAGVFEAYVIDAVPERDDLGCQQLITSTQHFEEVRTLLDQTLSRMGLSVSARNCRDLLNELKGLSGRLAMRLAAGAVRAGGVGNVGAELIALSLVRRQCRRDTATNEPCWLDLNRGFFVPLDDVRDLVPIPEWTDPIEQDDDALPNATAARADLLHVEIPKARGRLALRFVEVKYRRHLSQARSPDLVDAIAEQVEVTSQRWMHSFFDEKVPGTERTLRAARLGRVLRFYAEKAHRHHLPDEPYERFLKELALYLGDPVACTPSLPEAGDRGYIFCPDFAAPNGQPEKIGGSWNGHCSVWLFGPDAMFGISAAAAAPPDDVLPERAGGAAISSPVESDEREKPPKVRSSSSESTTPAASAILLGESKSGEAVHWTMSIKSNPHLMVVGLPGMGKTTCLISLCAQLQRGGIAPIVFSYHDDIDERLAALFPDAVARDCTQLGFNPMRVAHPGPLAHIESAGQIRDIFNAIHADLGDLQLEQLRAALKQSYQEAGWGQEGSKPEPPLFRRFVDILRETGGKDQRTQTLLARLTELDDFRFFDVREDQAGLLSSPRPQLIRIHSVSNEAMQRACAGFILYRIYQEMFARGRPTQITHAVVFDEAHRAGRLKLLPTMAKECRKYGLALIVASQEACDFDPGLFAAIGSYLVLRVTDNDARIMSRNAAGSDFQRAIADRMKALPKYEGLFFSENQSKPVQTRLRTEVE
jgi:DNA phosphorothioation-dependent restriction protein DptH